jgi:hypothetical protein
MVCKLIICCPWFESIYLFYFFLAYTFNAPTKSFLPLGVLGGSLIFVITLGSGLLKIFKRSFGSGFLEQKNQRIGQHWY